MTTDRGNGTHGRTGGGIPDGLLVGVMALLLGVTGLFWTATGLAGLLSHGSWPDDVTFVKAPMALRALLTDPRDLPGAWPDTPPEQLSGHGLFWGVLVSQVLFLGALALGVLSAVGRWRLRRRQRRASVTDVPPPPIGDDAQQPDGVVEAAPAPAPTEAVTKPPAARRPTASDVPPSAAFPPHQDIRSTPAEPADIGTRHAGPPRPAAETPATTASPGPATPSSPPTFTLRYGTFEEQGHEAEQAIVTAPGPVLVVTPRARLWESTQQVRRRYGPTHLYDPSQLVDAPQRLRWAPTRRCTDMDTARRRAAALLAPVRPRSRLDSALADAAETLLRCWLHAAAVADAPFRQVHRWATGSSPGEAVRVLRTHTDAASGAAGELESVLVAHPERRDAAMALVQRALGALRRLHVRNSCTGSRPDALAVESFLTEGGTLYVVGEAVEDPRRGDPGTMPFLTALTSSVVESGRRMAVRSSPGRLDPPLTLVLDQVAQVAPLPELPSLQETGDAYGFRTLALLRSREQAHYWWPTLGSASR